MTNEKAKEILKLYKERLENSVSTELANDIMAFKMAIQAIESLDCDCSDCLWYQLAQKNLDGSGEEE